MPYIVFEFSCFVHSTVDAADFLYPAPPVPVFQGHDLIVAPVEVIRNKGYLLLELLQGVANNPPEATCSVVNTCLHCGHVAVGRSWST